MNSLTLFAIGNLARDPEVNNTKDSKSYTRFCLVTNDYNGKDEDGTAKEIVTTVWLVAYGAIGESIAKNARKGDQLIVDARMRANNWMKAGELQYNYSFICEGFRFGAPGKAKRELLRASVDQQLATDLIGGESVDKNEEEVTVAFA